MAIHCEGLVNETVYKSLIAFGKGISFRPLLALITPFSPMYLQDPLEDKERRTFLGRLPNHRDLEDFQAKFAALSERFEIGYHGHFYSKTGLLANSSFEPDVVSVQLDSEVDLFNQSGLRPVVYSGGWWFTSPWLSQVLKMKGFKIDTTMNDTGQDSFGRPQPPMDPSLKNILSFRSLRNIRYFGSGLIAFHDYDLPRSEWLSGKLGKKLNLGSFDEVVRASG